MSDSQVIVVSLAIGFGVGLSLLMVLWACRACLGKPKKLDDDNEAMDAPVRRQRASSLAQDAAQQTTVELPAQPEQAHDRPSVMPQSPSVQRVNPPAAIHFPTEQMAPSPNLSMPSPGPGPAAPSPLPTKATPQIVLPTGPMAFASPSPLPTRLSHHGTNLPETPSPEPSMPNAEASATSQAPTVPSASVALPPPPLPAAAAVSTESTTHAQAAVPTLAQLDPTIPEPTPESGVLPGAFLQDTLTSPMPSGVPSQPSVVPSDVSIDPSGAQGYQDGVPALNLDPVNAARAKCHNAEARTYPDPSSSVLGTTAEIGSVSHASDIPNAMSTATRSYQTPLPQPTVSATQSLESHQAQLLAKASNQEVSKVTLPSIESHQITEDEASSVVSDAAVTIGGLTVRALVDEQQPVELEPEVASYSAALQLATGVEAVEASGSFTTAVEEDDQAVHAIDSELEPDPAQEKITAFDKKGDIDDGLTSVTGTAVLAHYEDVVAADEDEDESVGTPYTGIDTSRTVGAASLAFMEGSQRYLHRPEARFVPTAADLNGSQNDVEPGDLPPGAVVRGRDPLMEQLMSGKLSQDFSGFSRTNSGNAGASTLPSATQSPLGTFPGNIGGLWEQKSMTSMSDNYRFIPDQDSLLSIPVNPDMGESETLPHSVAISDASEWTLSAPTRTVGSWGPSSALSRGTNGAPSRRNVPGYAESMASGVSAAFSDASDWTLSGGNTRQVSSLRIPSSRRGIGTTRSQLGQSSALTMMSSRSGTSNWTLSGGTGKVGAPSQRLSSSKWLDDGKSVAFTDGGSEWALSPRSAVVKDDVDVGHSRRWMQPEEITMPARPAAQANTRGLRDKFEQRTLRQKYASDDTTVPEYAVRRVQDWMGAMGGDTRDEVMLRLTAQQSDF